MLEDEGTEPDAGKKRRARQRLAIAIGSVLATAGLAYLALLLGAWGFDTRRYGLHEGRLARLLARRPLLEQVVQAFADEGAELIGSPRGETELRRLAAERGGPRGDDVVRKGALWPATRVFVAGDMVYFVFFDEAGVMRDFAIASR